jgi:hypothetical protein
MPVVAKTKRVGVTIFALSLLNFNSEHKARLGHCKMILESEGGRIAINPVFDKLITSLRTAVDKDGTLQKEETSYNDILEAFRLALKFYQFGGS